jgi:hypothetical protein
MFGFKLVRTKKDCALLKQIFDRVGNAKIPDRLVEFIVYTYRECGKYDKSLLLLAEHGWDGADLNDVANLAGKIDPAETLGLLKSISRQKDSTIKSFIMALLHLKTDEPSKALSILNTMDKNQDSWFKLLRIMALYKSGRPNQAQALTDDLVREKDTAAEWARKLSKALKNWPIWTGPAGMRIGLLEIYLRKILWISALCGLVLLGLWLWWTRPGPD